MSPIDAKKLIDLQPQLAERIFGLNLDAVVQSVFAFHEISDIRRTNLLQRTGSEGTEMIRTGS
jgi:hypothetical protein